MAKPVKSIQRFIAGIADFIKEGTQDSFYFARGVDVRSDPRSATINPRAVKESGTVVEDLPKWGEVVGTSMYYYGDTGKLYKRTSTGAHSKLRQAPESHGNGLSYFGEDDFLYYTTDKVIGRYGPLSSASPQFADDYFGSQGGVPLNTNSLQLVAASSQYASRADTATLSVTGDLSIEAQIKPTTLPTGTDKMTLVSKWNGSGNLRSYKFGIGTESNYFGDGSDGALTISVNTTDAPIDSACTGTTGTQTLTATNASFTAGQVILIHQTQGTGAGTWMRNTIQSYTAGTITLDEALNATYSTGAQVLVMKQYTDVTVNTGITWTAKAWNGTIGGILAFLANGTVTVTGTITASGKGFRGGVYSSLNVVPANQGEGTAGAGASSTAANGNGGGGGEELPGAGGGNGTAGSRPVQSYNHSNYGGNESGSADLTTITFGGGGGGGEYEGGGTAGSGKEGGGIIFISGITFTVTGSIVSAGIIGGSSTTRGGGGGAGGSILIKSQVATLGTSLITALGGAGGPGSDANGTGGAGGAGRIHIDYYTSYTGTTTPTINATQDPNLGASEGNTLFIQISDDGTDTETYTISAPSLAVDVWQQAAVSLDVSVSTAEFFYNAVSLGTVTKSMTGIYDSTSDFFIGTHKDDTGTATDFYNGLIDEVKVWSKVKTAEEYLSGISRQTLTTLPNGQAYYKLNGDYADATGNSNTLTGTNTPVFVTDVPFSSPTDRLDIDQQATTAGNTYTTPLAIAETATARKTFVPEKDPQKSIAVLIASVGTGDWTVTVHDEFNNEIAAVTVANAALSAGYYEFTFATPWRPLLNANYHFHITSTVADGTVTATNAGDLETVSFRTYFQFLITDTEWHPVARMLQFLVFGNERYVATYEAGLYNPNKITLPAGYRVRCFGYFREYLAIGTMRGSTISEQDSGRIYFWDGISSTYNFFLDVPEGGINALLGSKGKLYVFAGYQGDILEYTGGDTATQVKRLPKIEPDKAVEVFPQAVCMWKMLTRIGYTGNSDSSNIERGVYTWGSQNVRYPDAYTFDFPVSTGNYGTSIKIGLVMAVNKKLLIGYQDNVSYGIDYVDSSNAPYATSTLEAIIDDDQVAWKEKSAMQIVATFKPLNTGESVDVKYKLDRADTWTYLGEVTTAGADLARLIVATNGQRYREIQYGVDLKTSVSTAPTLLSLVFERDFNEEEERIG